MHFYLKQSKELKAFFRRMKILLFKHVFDSIYMANIGCLTNLHIRATSLEDLKTRITRGFKKFIRDENEKKKSGERMDAENSDDLPTEVPRFDLQLNRLNLGPDHNPDLVDWLSTSVIEIACERENSNVLEKLFIKAKLPTDVHGNFVPYKAKKLNPAAVEAAIIANEVYTSNLTSLHVEGWHVQHANTIVENIDDEYGATLREVMEGYDCIIAINPMTNYDITGAWKIVTTMEQRIDAWDIISKVLPEKVKELPKVIIDGAYWEEEIRIRGKRTDEDVEEHIEEMVQSLPTQQSSTASVASIATGATPATKNTAGPRKRKKGPNLIDTDDSVAVPIPSEIEARARQAQYGDILKQQRIGNDTTHTKGPTINVWTNNRMRAMAPTPQQTNPNPNTDQVMDTTDGDSVDTASTDNGSVGNGSIDSLGSIGNRSVGDGSDISSLQDSISVLSKEMEALKNMYQEERTQRLAMEKQLASIKHDNAKRDKELKGQTTSILQLKSMFETQLKENREDRQLYKEDRSRTEFIYQEMMGALHDFKVHTSTNTTVTPTVPTPMDPDPNVGYTPEPATIMYYTEPNSTPVIDTPVESTGMELDKDKNESGHKRTRNPAQQSISKEPTVANGEVPTPRSNRNKNKVLRQQSIRSWGSECATSDEESVRSNKSQKQPTHTSEEFRVVTEFTNSSASQSGSSISTEEGSETDYDLSVLVKPSTSSPNRGHRSPNRQANKVLQDVAHRTEHSQPTRTEAHQLVTTAKENGNQNQPSSLVRAIQGNGPGGSNAGPSSK